MSSPHTCDRCGNPATVHVTEIADGKLEHSHLCQKCAKLPGSGASHTNTTKTYALKPTNCSFCGKSSGQVGPMVEGPNNIYICSACSEVAQGVFQQNTTR